MEGFSGQPLSVGIMLSSAKSQNPARFRSSAVVRFFKWLFRKIKGRPFTESHNIVGSILGPLFMEPPLFVLVLHDVVTRFPGRRS